MDNLLKVVRSLGGFQIARWMTRKRLRILCYHGFSEGDEHVFNPFLFMRASVFAGRLEILKRREYPVTTLREGLERLKTHRVRNAETVITLDDGWRSNLTLGLPLLTQYGFPACVYVTTEHFGTGFPVFNVALWYLIWKTDAVGFLLEGFGHPVDGYYPLKEKAVESGRRLIGATARLEIEARHDILKIVATQMGIPLDESLGHDRLRLMEADELRRFAEHGLIEVELHTHRHHLPTDRFETMAADISMNRAALARIIGHIPRQFCYPSGHYGPQQPEWLRLCGIESATTCDPGLNSHDQDFMLLRRHLDRDDVSDVRFEAEMSGLLEIARELRLRFFPRSARRQLQAIESTR